MINEERILQEIKNLYYILDKESLSPVPFKVESLVKSTNYDPNLFMSVEGDLVFYNNEIYQLISYSFLDKNETQTIVSKNIEVSDENEITINPRCVDIFPEECIDLELFDYLEAKEYYEDNELFIEWLNRRVLDLRKSSGRFSNNDIIKTFLNERIEITCN